ncbi:MAG: SAM-dependent methyltransferase [Burkholderiales bacterium]
MRSALYAIPTPLGGVPADALPGSALEIVRGLREFVAENAKSARTFLAAVGMPCPLRELRIEVLDQNTRIDSVPALLAPLREGRALGLLSEAGCPAIADPGAALVAAAHRDGYRVVPLIGPSSIMLALMASGLEGQRFAFWGYLPREKDAREMKLRELEHRSRADAATQIFIETPYRNDAMVSSLLRVCSPETRLCIASNLTLPQEHVRTHTVAVWRTQPPALARHPSVFMLLA